jgi:hypothetical protein
MEPVRASGETDTPTRLELRCGFATDTGPRERNEDFAAFFAGSREQQARLGAVAAIADGVGGAKGGREAAELAVSKAISAGTRRSASTAAAPARWRPSIPGRMPSAAATRRSRGWRAR